MRATEQSQRIRELSARAAVNERTARRYLAGHQPGSRAILRALDEAADALGIERPRPVPSVPDAKP